MGLATLRSGAIRKDKKCSLPGKSFGKWLCLWTNATTAKIPADSVTLLRMSWDKEGRCGFFDAQGNTQFSSRIRFLEIDTTVYGRCFDKPNCKVSEALITPQAVLQASYRLFCGEEGVTCGGLMEFLPRP
jgi:hypothetical protein